MIYKNKISVESNHKEITFHNVTAQVKETIKKIKEIDLEDVMVDTMIGKISDFCVMVAFVSGACAFVFFGFAFC